MPVVTTVSNHAKYQIVAGNIDFSSDVFKAILLNTTFAFDKDSHATLADVSSSQISNGNGYTQNDKTLTGVSILENDTDDKAIISWSDPTWTASGGSIGPFGAMIIYDDTTADDAVVFCVDFGVDYTIPDTGGFEPQGIEIQVS